MSRPNLVALGALISGIATAAYYRFHPLGWLLVGLILLSGVIWRHLTCHQGSGWLFLGVLLCGGAGLFSYARGDYQDQLLYNRAFSGKNLVVMGRIVSRPERTVHGSRFELRLSKYRGLPRGKVTVYYRQALSEAWLGREIRVLGRFKTVRATGTSWPDFYERRRLTGI